MLAVLGAAWSRSTSPAICAGAPPRRVTNNELFVALLVDVAALTAQLYLSGGATNPFVFLYLLQVTLAAVLLEACVDLDHGRR